MILLLFILSMTGIVVQAESQTTVNLTFNKQTFSKGEIIQIDFSVGDTFDLIGIQIDFKENDFFGFYDGIVPYRTDEFLESNAMTEILNDYDTNNQDIASLILIGNQGVTYDGFRAYASLYLVAKQDIDNIFDYISVTNVLEDVALNLYTMSIKLSDSAANPITYQSQYLVKHQAQLKPGIDTVYLGQAHEDAGVNLINVDSENAQIDVVSNVDTSIAGEYLIQYLITNLETGIEIGIERYVYVISRDLIQISLNPSIDTYQVGDTFMDAGAIARIDTDVFTCDVLYSDVNMDQEGSYKVVYGYAYEGVMYRVTRIITVIEQVYAVNEGMGNE